MDLVHFISFLAGLSSLSLLGVVELKKWQRRQMMAVKLRRVSEALEQAVESLARFQERHDKILVQMNSQYLCHREMEVALSGARKAMDEAQQFCTQLRRLQMKLLTLYPGGLGDPFTVMPGTCADQ